MCLFLQQVPPSSHQTHEGDTQVCEKDQAKIKSINLYSQMVESSVHWPDIKKSLVQA